MKPSRQEGSFSKYGVRSRTAPERMKFRANSPLHEKKMSGCWSVPIWMRSLSLMGSSPAASIWILTSGCAFSKSLATWTKKSLYSTFGHL